MRRHSPLDCEIDNEALTCPHCVWVSPRPNLRRNCRVRMKIYFRWHWGDLLAIVIRRWCPPAIYEWLGFAECGACGRRRELLNYWGTACERRLAATWLKLKFCLRIGRDRNSDGGAVAG